MSEGAGSAGSVRRARPFFSRIPVPDNSPQLIATPRDQIEALSLDDKIEWLRQHCLQDTRTPEHAEIAALKGQIQSLSEKTRELTRSDSDDRAAEPAPASMQVLRGSLIETPLLEPAAHACGPCVDTCASPVPVRCGKITLKVQQKIEELQLDEEGALQFQIDYLNDVNSALAEQAAAAMEIAATKDAMISEQQDEIELLQERCDQMQKLISVGADRMRFFEEQRDASLTLLRKVIAEGKQLEIARQRLLTLLLNENVTKHYKEGMREALLSGEVETAVKLIRQVEQSLSQQAECEADKLDDELENLHTCAGEKPFANAIHVHTAVVPAGEPADQGIVTDVSARVSEKTQDARRAVPTQASDVDVIADSQSDHNETSPPSMSATDLSLAETLAGQAVLCESGDDLIVRKEESEEFFQHATTLEQIKMGFAPSQVPTLTPFNTPCKEAEAPRVGVGKGQPVKQGTSPHSSPNVTEGARRLLEEASLEFGKITPPSPILQSEPCTVTAEVQISVDLYRVSHGGAQKVKTEQGEANERRTRRSIQLDEGGIPQNQQQTDILVVPGPQARLSRASKPHSPTAPESSNVHSLVQSVVKVPAAGSDGSANLKERSQFSDTVRFTDRGRDVDTARFSSSHDSDVIALARGLEHDKKNLEKSIDEIKAELKRALTVDEALSTYNFHMQAMQAGLQDDISGASPEKGSISESHTAAHAAEKAIERLILSI